MKHPLVINPQTKIGEMLEAYPQLEEVLLELSPSFAKLKNPILRKTVGRIASLRQAAEIGGVPVGKLVSTLQKAAGLDQSLTEEADGTSGSGKPEWVDTNLIVITFDASPIIESGGNPMKDILEKAGQLAGNNLLLLITPFKPIPIIELLQSQGYAAWSNEKEEQVYTYLRKVRIK